MKLTNQQILEIITQINEEIALKMKRMEELSSTIEQHYSKHLSELKNIAFVVDDRGVKESMKFFDTSIVQAKKTLVIAQKDSKILLYSILFCLIGACFFLFTFFYGIKSKQDIISEYHYELQNQNRVLSEDDALFIQKLRVWKSKNSKDSDKLFREIENNY